MRSTRKQDWKLFEETVAQIEKVLAPKGAVVKSPDRITDLITKQQREVDASIRYYQGSCPVLITVECRHRKKVQDDMWIEQLVTKQKKIGATKTIAVSSNGFTKPAQMTAKEFGIELRTCLEVPDEQVLDMLDGMSFSATAIFRHIENLHIQVENKDKPSGLVKPKIDEDIEKNQQDAVIAYTESEGKGIRLSELIEIMDESTQSEEDQTRKLNGEALTLTIEVDNDFWYYPVNGFKYGIRKIQLTLRFGSSVESIPITSVSNYYSGQTEVAQLVKATLQLDEKTSAYISLVR